jgi:hypothetical protein
MKIRDRRAFPRRYCSIEDERLYHALSHVARSRWFYGYLNRRELEVIDGVLVEGVSTEPHLTELGVKTYQKLKRRCGYEISNCR